MIRRLYNGLRLFRASLAAHSSSQAIDGFSAAAEPHAAGSISDIQDRPSNSPHDPLQGETQRLSDQINLALAELSLLASRQLEFQRETRLMLGSLALPPSAVWDKPWTLGGQPDKSEFLKSAVCRQESFEAPAFYFWMRRLGVEPRYHRKLWEFMFIGQALQERGLLRPGARGLGFGVGEEPLTAIFAASGCAITATDMAPEAAAEVGWVETAQHAAGREALRRPFLCQDKVFDANVEFRACDMNHIPDDLIGYDFCWSACALEHLGSIDLGLKFMERSLDTLKPGGFAIHTTEYNVSSNDDTVSEGGTVLFRRRDIERFAEKIHELGHTLAPLDLDPGDGPLDRYIDVAPYRDNPHLKLALHGYAATSIGLIIQKATG